MNKVIPNRMIRHRQGAHRVLRSLARRGFAAVRSSRHGTDVVVNGQTACVRVARVRLAEHRVTVRGKTYEYQYRKAIFNLHRHGQILPNPPTFWVLTWLDRRWRYAIIPHTAVARRKVVEEFVDSGGGQSVVARHLGRWDVFGTRHKAA